MLLDYISDMDYLQNRQDQCEFEEVAVYFSEEEWDCLNEDEKELYRDVMIENYQTLRSLGRIDLTPPIILVLERGEEPYLRGNQHTKKSQSLCGCSPVSPAHLRAPAASVGGPMTVDITAPLFSCTPAITQRMP
ncbi:gastrula zinc finger -like [Pelobates cultripes]|uniref:Gastrula zinc finger -like n=1 Tax=Pelobates cultripes TaxID=61616 RepID=A0AAD1WSY1_PELCU|nr:gastrula zinc finger -like [Pelobates cultripes]